MYSDTLFISFGEKVLRLEIIGIAHDVHQRVQSHFAADSATLQV